MPSWLDKTISWIATGGKSDDWQAQIDENDKRIAENWRRIINDPKTNPADRMAAERELAAFLGELETAPRIADEAAKEFGAEYAATAKKVGGGVGSFVGSLLPWYVWALIGLALVAYLVPFFLKRK